MEKRKPITRTRLQALVALTRSGYSFDRYGERAWIACLRLLAKTYTDEEITAIMLSKWPRWAGDCARNPDRPNSKDLQRFMASMKDVSTEVRRLAQEHFRGEEAAQS